MLTCFCADWVKKGIRDDLTYNAVDKYVMGSKHGRMQFHLKDVRFEFKSFPFGE